MKPIYLNNRKAPRMRKGKFSRQIVTKQAWSEFKKQYPEYKGLSWEDFYTYWKDIAETIRNETVMNPLGVKLGSYTGELKTQYLPNKFEKATDHNVSAELGEDTKHMNLVTRGRVARIKWERRWAVKFNRMLQFFAFEPTREINEIAVKYITSNPDKLRIARSTLGGYSIWRQLKNK